MFIRLVYVKDSFKNDILCFFIVQNITKYTYYESGTRYYICTGSSVRGNPIYHPNLIDYGQSVVLSKGHYKFLHSR